MMEIRPLEHSDDLQAVGQLYVDSWQQTYQRILPQHFLDRLTPDRWSAVLAAEPENWLGLFVDETLKGAAMLGFSRDETCENCGEIVSLYLQPGEEGKGYGRKLLEGCLAHCREQGCENICLWVMCANTHAIYFYMHMGFHPTGRVQEESYGGESVELMEMHRKL